MVSPTVKERSFLISNVRSENCTDLLNFPIQITQNVICPRNFVIKLLEMMSLTNIVKITESRSDTTTICVTASNYLCEQIMTAIKRVIAKTYYRNISSVNAKEIIRELRIKDCYVYYIDDDEFGCLVVLHEFNNETYFGTQYYQEFREKYEKINQSRTVVMTPAQRDTLLSEEMKPSVEFTSVLPDGQIEVVFRREAIQTVIPEIKRLVEIDNIRRRLEELTSLK